MSAVARYPAAVLATGYFASIPSARCYVVVRERAHWIRDGEELSQTSLAVCEIEDARVRRVWYHPSGD